MRKMMNPSDFGSAGRGRVSSLRASSLALLLVFGGAWAGSVAHAEDTADFGSSSSLTGSSSPRQQIDSARQHLDQMRDDLKTVTKIGEEADKDGNVDQIQCVKKALANIKALVGAAERSQTTMKDAIDEGQLDKASAAFRQVEVAAGKVKNFVRDANECTGARGTTEGKTELSVTGGSPTDDPETPWDDFSEGFFEQPRPTRFR